MCSSSQCRFPCYKLIIMDLNMPVMNGFDASQKILDLYRQYPKKLKLGQQPVKIVALTSYTDKQTLDRCRAIGIDKVFHKPLKFNEMEEIVGLHHMGMSELLIKQYFEIEELKKIQISEVLQQQEKDRIKNSLQNDSLP